MQTELSANRPSLSIMPKDPRDPFVRADVGPATAASVEAAIDARDAERAVIGYIPPTSEEWERLAVQEGLYNLIQKYGAKRVTSWVRNLATIAGQEV